MGVPECAKPDGWGSALCALLRVGQMIIRAYPTNQQDVRRVSFLNSQTCLIPIIHSTWRFNMAEPQPSTVHEGANDPTVEDDHPAPPPASAEDRKAAAALESLDVRGDHEEAGKKSEADQKALGEAMSRITLLEAAGAGGKKEKEKKEESPAEIRQRERKEAEEKEAERRRKVKVDTKDIATVVRTILASF